MSFTTNLANMEQFHVRLAALAHPAPIQSVVRDALSHLCQRAHEFDTCVSADSPFYHEFFHNMRHSNTNEDTCFALFECLVLFCREKTLLHPDELPDAQEYSILRHFENSGHWQKNDSTLIQEWYWSILPQRRCCRKVCAAK